MCAGNETHFNVTLLGDPGRNITVFVSYTAYTDLAGNYGNEDLIFSVQFPEIAGLFMAEAGSAAVLGTMAATTTISIASASAILCDC